MSVFLKQQSIALLLYLEGSGTHPSYGLIDGYDTSLLIEDHTEWIT